MSIPVVVLAVVAMICATFIGMCFIAAAAAKKGGSDQKRGRVSEMIRLKGDVLLDEIEIGTFTVDEEDNVAINLRMPLSNIADTLEYAGETGQRFILSHKPEYDSKS